MTTDGELPGPQHSPAALQARRKQAKLRQDELARRAGCSQGFISMLERGERNPSLAQLHRLAAALGCTVTDLIPRQREAS